ncbi:MAG TPA: PaaI family thioesterase [Methylomirabilota bacterium]|nr:PaaI family thioesterase [Methylomirabilota bacterium]
MTGWQAANPDFVRATRAFALEMPVVQHLGFDFTDVRPGAVEITQPWTPAVAHREGFFQGGIIGALCDFAGGCASFTLLPAGWLTMTIDFTVKILAPAEGDRLVVRGHVLKHGLTISVNAAEAFAVQNGRETHCASAFVTMRHVRAPAGGAPAER